jgi:hypothetical protein
MMEGALLPGWVWMCLRRAFLFFFLLVWIVFVFGGKRAHECMVFEYLVGLFAHSCC